MELAGHDFGELGSYVDGSVILISKRGLAFAFAFVFALAGSEYWIPVAVGFAVCMSSSRSDSLSRFTKELRRKTSFT